MDISEKKMSRKRRDQILAAARQAESFAADCEKFAEQHGRSTSQSAITARAAAQRHRELAATYTEPSTEGEPTE